MVNYFFDTDLSLVKTTDEVCESIHQYLNDRFMTSNYYVKDLECQAQGKKLFRCVSHFNSYSLDVNCDELMSVINELKYLLFF